MRNFYIPFGLALLLSLLLHLFFFNTFNKTLKNRDLKINSTDEIKEDKKKGYTSIKYVKLQKPKIIEKPLPEPKKPKPPIQKPIKKVPKNIVKKRTKPIIKDPKIAKNIKTIKIPEAEKTVDLKQLFTMTPEEKATQEEQKNQEIDKERYLIKKLDPSIQQLINFYGEEYYSFSEEQKEYIKKNLRSIKEVTKYYLKYPALAIKTRQSGMNIVKFVLHPNGDITDLHISNSSGYTALDKNTIETIQIAYKDYPKPKEATQIIFNIRYILEYY